MTKLFIASVVFVLVCPLASQAAIQCKSSIKIEEQMNIEKYRPDVVMILDELNSDIDPNFVLAIIRQESNGNPYAVRYEPRFYNWLSNKMKTVPSFGASRATELNTRSSSFGLMQLMGETARNLGFKGPFLTELCEPYINIKLGITLLEKLFKQYGSETLVLASYNAGSPRLNSSGVLINQHYVESVLSHYKELRTANA